MVEGEAKWHSCCDLRKSNISRCSSKVAWEQERWKLKKKLTERLAVVKKRYNYSEIMLVDSLGNVYLTTGDHQEFDQSFKARLRESSYSGSPLHTGIYRSTATTKIHFDFISQLKNEQEKSDNVFLVFRTNPEEKKNKTHKQEQTKRRLIIEKNQRPDSTQSPQVLAKALDENGGDKASFEPKHKRSPGRPEPCKTQKPPKQWLPRRRWPKPADWHYRE